MTWIALATNGELAVNCVRDDSLYWCSRLGCKLASISQLVACRSALTRSTSTTVAASQDVAAHGCCLSGTRVPLSWQASRLEHSLVPPTNPDTQGDSPWLSYAEPSRFSRLSRSQQ